MNKEQNKIFIKINEVATASNRSLRTIRRNCTNGKYETRLVNGNGGMQYEILLSSLEPEIQEKFLSDTQHNNVLTAETTVKSYSVGDKDCALLPVPVSLNLPVTTDETALIPIISKTEVKAPERTIPQKAKDEAMAKFNLVNLWQDFRNNKPDKRIADNDFILLYNNGISYPKIYAILGNISVRTLQRWNKNIADCDGTWKSLVPNYSYGNENEYKTQLSELEITLARRLLLDSAKYSVGTVHRLIKYAFAQKGITEMSSYSSYKRYFNNYRKQHNDVWTLMRDGQKALLDTIVPYIERDLKRLNVGDMIVADGHVLDFKIKNPITGRPCRPTMIAYQDMRSCDILGYELMVTENTQNIASALRNSIIRLGKCPKVAYQDNGAAFRGKYFTGSEDFKEIGFFGVFAELGIIPVFAKPYNGKAKPIERTWREFTNIAAKAQDSYVGNNIVNKPAQLMRNEKFHKKYKGKDLPTLAEAKKVIEMWLEFYRSQPCPNEPDKTIGEVFELGKGSGVDVNALDELMMQSVSRKVGRNGVELFGFTYFDEALYGIFGTVEVKYSLFDLSYVRVYTHKGKFLCTAKTSVATHPSAGILGDVNDVANLKSALGRQKRLEQKTIKEAEALMKHRSEVLPFKAIVKKDIKNITKEKTELINIY